MGKLGFLVQVDRRGVTKHWLVVNLDEHWTIAYRLTYQGEGATRRTRIAEVRIVARVVTGAGGDFLDRDYAAWEADADRTNVAGRASRTLFPFQAVRRVITPRHFDDALQAMTTFIAEHDPEFPSPPTKREAPSRPKPGRPGRDPAFYAAFALEYDDVEHGTRREPGDSTREILARRRKKPVTTIAKWIHIARGLGFLTPVVRGQRGGRATAAARRVREQQTTRQRKDSQ